jgi:hypothetical protein
MGAQVGGGLKLIFLNQVPRFRTETCSGVGLELLCAKAVCNSTRKREVRLPCGNT